MGLLLLRLSTYSSDYGSSTAQSATVKGPRGSPTFGMVQRVVLTFATVHTAVVRTVASRPL
jgi:hypothetical protein